MSNFITQIAGSRERLVVSASAATLAAIGLTACSSALPDAPQTLVCTGVQEHKAQLGDTFTGLVNQHVKLPKGTSVGRVASATAIESAAGDLPGTYYVYGTYVAPNEEITAGSTYQLPVSCDPTDK